MSRVTLKRGNSKELLRTLADCSVDSIVTDPPYELGFMGKGWDKSGIANDPELWAEALRVLKPGGYLLAFSGARTYHRMACAIEDGGFEVRDQIMWLYGSGYPKSKDTALKPAHEPICVARKPFSGTLAANRQRFGTGAFNIEACRVGAEDGRWPANLIHDGSDEVLAAFPDAAGQAAAVRGTEPSASTSATFGKYERRAASEPRREVDRSAARFFYCAKASPKDRHDGVENPGPQFTHGATLRKVENTATAGNNHPTVKPTELMRYLCRLVTPPGGVVLDLFMGSGSTGRGARLEGFGFIGFELSPEYVEISRRRIAAVDSDAIPLLEPA